MGVRACIVTANAQDADLSQLKGHDVHVVPSDATLTFEHTYTFWVRRPLIRHSAHACCRNLEEKCNDVINY